MSSFWKYRYWCWHTSICWDKFEKHSELYYQGPALEDTAGYTNHTLSAYLTCRDNFCSNEKERYFVYLNKFMLIETMGRRRDIFRTVKMNDASQKVFEVLFQHLTRVMPVHNTPIVPKSQGHCYDNQILRSCSLHKIASVHVVPNKKVSQLTKC